MAEETRVPPLGGDKPVPAAFLRIAEGMTPVEMVAVLHSDDEEDHFEPQVWAVLCKREAFHPDLVGLIPSFLNENDPTPIAKQIDAAYQHGGGWRPIAGMSLEAPFRLRGHNDTRGYQPIAFTHLSDREEQVLVIVFESGMTAIMQADGSYEVARLD